MRTTRWRWVVIPMIVLVAACLPQQPAFDVPGSFTAVFSGDGYPTFTRQPPPGGETGEDIVAALRNYAQVPMVDGRAVPVYGLIDCHGVQGCAPGPAVWVVFYPDCLDYEGNDVGWVIVDAVTGVDDGIMMNDVCRPGR
jgi:hypothetical protein